MGTFYFLMVRVGLLLIALVGLSVAQSCTFSGEWYFDGEKYGNCDVPAGSARVFGPDYHVELQNMTISGNVTLLGQKCYVRDVELSSSGVLFLNCSAISVFGLRATDNAVIHDKSISAVFSDSTGMDLKGNSVYNSEGTLVVRNSSLVSISSNATLYNDGEMVIEAGALVKVSSSGRLINRGSFYAQGDCEGSCSCSSVGTGVRCENSFKNYATSTTIVNLHWK